MKRTLAMLLALCMLLSLTACRSGEERRTMRRQMDLYNGKAQPELPATLALQDGTTLDEQVVYQSGGVTITVLGIYEDEYSYRIPITLRNGSGNSVYWGSGNRNQCSVNGFHTTMRIEGGSDVCTHGAEAAALTIDKDDIPLVMTPGNISTQFFLRDQETRASSDIPVNLTTSAGEGANREPLSDTPFWTDGTLDLYLLYADQDNFFRKVYLYADNRGTCDYYLSIQEGSLSVNGLEASNLNLWNSGFIDSETKMVFRIDLSKYDLGELGILPGTPLETLDFSANLTKYARETEQSEIQLHIDMPAASDAAESQSNTAPAQKPERCFRVISCVP